MLCLCFLMMLFLLKYFNIDIISLLAITITIRRHTIILAEYVKGCRDLPLHPFQIQQEDGSRYVEKYLVNIPVYLIVVITITETNVMRKN